MEDIITDLRKAIAIFKNNEPLKRENIDELKGILQTLIEKYPPPSSGGVSKGGKGRKRRGGAEVNLATQGSQILNTSDILQNPFNAIPVTQPWAGPMPFSAGNSIPTDLTSGLGQSVTSSIDPSITIGGAKKKAPSKKKAAPSKKKQSRT